MNDLIFISLENWDDIWRRNQFVCATLARRHPDMRIVFVGVPRNFARHLRGGRLRDFFADPTQTLSDFPNITITRPPRLGPETYDWGLHLNERLFRRHVAAVTRSLRDPILWINSHSAYHLVPHIPHASLIYDITDDWISLNQTPIDHKRTIAADRHLCETADATIVCSQRLYDLKREFTRSIHLIPNGVDAGHYASIINRALPIAPEIAALPNPVLGYTGTLHEDRIDLSLLQKIARDMTSGSIALVGPSHLKPDQIAALNATGRVHLFPAVPYQRIPEIMRGFDLCISPVLVTPFTESLNPIKLWEYLASGKPIISTPVAGFRDYPSFVTLASTSGQFISAIAPACNEPPTGPEARQAEARKHSWDSRVDAIEQVFFHRASAPPVVTPAH